MNDFVDNLFHKQAFGKLLFLLVSSASGDKDIICGEDQIHEVSGEKNHSEGLALDNVGYTLEESSSAVSLCPETAWDCD